MKATIQFLGATGTVTGSRTLVRVNGYNLLVDCGLFQGSQLKELNWEPFPIDPAEIDAVILTHGHIDHIGYLPKLVKDGFHGPVYTSPASADICRISLPDSANLQEEDARYANKKGFSKHTPALPLYTSADAALALTMLKTLTYEHREVLAPNLSFRLLRSGHIFGSAFVELILPGPKKLLLTGDLGRYDQPIIRDPQTVSSTDYLVLESTYGDRLHSTADPLDDLEKVINETFERSGMVIIPSFAIGRTQQLLYYLKELRDANRIPDIPIIVDSPMAVDTTMMFARHPEEHDLEMQELVQNGHSPLRSKSVIFARNRDESKRINTMRPPAILISSSGMLSGGRIMHHLALRLPDERNTVLFVGYQAEGTKGRDMLEGAAEVKIHGEMIPVRAQIRQMDQLSAHADYGEMLEWLGNFHKPPRLVFLNHGEPAAQESLKEKIIAKFGWQVVIPTRGQEFDI